jgi:DNA-directed RNA polymerase subunit E'/Rpb7
MNSDIRNNMKIVLKKKVEKRCNKNGYIDEVYKIIEFSDGIMIPENLNGSAIYNIAYQCRLCIPIENSIIIAYIKMISSDLIVAINGPLFIFIPKSYVDNNIWDIPEGFVHKKTSKKLVLNDYVKIQVLNKRINQGDTQIKIMGKLMDFANKDEVETYYGSKTFKNELSDAQVNGTNEESNFII